MYIYIYICLMLAYSQTELPGMPFGRVCLSHSSLTSSASFHIYLFLYVCAHTYILFPFFYVSSPYYIHIDGASGYAVAAAASPAPL